MKWIKPVFLLLAAGLFAAACAPDSNADPVQRTTTSPAPIAPEFAGINHWLNSPPLTLN